VPGDAGDDGGGLAVGRRHWRVDGRGGGRRGRGTDARGGCGLREGLGALAIAEAGQVQPEVIGGRVAGVRVLGQQLGHDRLVGDRHVRGEVAKPGRCLVDLLVGDGDGVVAHEGRPPADHLVHHDTQRVEVAAGSGGLACSGEK
jgi:hypothetical protein